MHGWVEQQVNVNVYVGFIGVSQTWKQPKSLSTDEWLTKLWFIYTMEY